MRIMRPREGEEERKGEGVGAWVAMCVCKQFGAQFKLPVLRIVWIADSKQLSAISTLLRERNKFSKLDCRTLKRRLDISKLVYSV